jgi:hypothetical protein
MSVRSLGRLLIFSGVLIGPGAGRVFTRMTAVTVRKGKARMAGDYAGHDVRATLSQRPVVYATAEGAPPSTPILVSLNTRAGELSALHETINLLEQRLAPVLRPVGPSAPQGSDQRNMVSPVRSHVAEHLDDIGAKVMSARDHLASLVERLDV